MFGAQRWGGWCCGPGPVCIALLLLLLLIFELVKLNFLFLLLWKCFVVPEELEEQREEQAALSKQDPPGAALGVLTARAGCVYNSFEYCWWWGCDWRFACPWVLMRGCTEVNEPSALTLSFAGSSDKSVLPWKCWGSELKWCWTLVAVLESAWGRAAGRKTGFLQRRELLLCHCSGNCRRKENTRILVQKLTQLFPQGCVPKPELWF